MVRLLLPEAAMARRVALLLCLLAGCREVADLDIPDADARSRSPDARPRGDAGDAGAAGPTGVTPIGSDDRVDVICWNVRQFPATPQTPALLAGMLRDLRVDVAALFEIDDDAAFRTLLDDLPGWSGYLGDGDGYIKGALVWRDAAVSVTGTMNLFDFDHDFPRPPIAATVSHGGDSMTLIAVHLKAGRTTDDAQRRENANGKLAGWLAARGNPRALVCGDFNEDLDNAYAPDVYRAWLAAPQDYRILTAALDHGGAETYLPATRVMFDQMISTAALDAELADEAAFIPQLDRQVAGYETVVSDHLPVALAVDLR